MNGADAALLLHESVIVMLRLAGPPLIAMLIAGVAVALLQAVTQINESSLLFVPKLVVLGGVLMLGGQWMFATLANYTLHIFARVASLGSL